MQELRVAAITLSEAEIIRRFLNTWNADVSIRHKCNPRLVIISDGTIVSKLHEGLTTSSITPLSNDTKQDISMQVVPHEADNMVAFFSYKPHLQFLRFFNCETNFSEDEMNDLKCILETTPAVERHRFFSGVMLGRRRDIDDWTSSSLLCGLFSRRNKR